MGPLIVADHGPLPTTLVDLLSNTLVLRQLAPYLPVSALHALAATSKDLNSIIYHAPDAFRYLDLSTVESAVVKDETPIDRGGVSWRAKRMDESLTEDEFYSGPLRGIFSKLQRRKLIRNVHTLVLDGLSVTADLVREIISDDRFNVRILSIREVKHLNQRKLMQVLRYAVRPTRAEGTPRIKGIYFFGPRDPVPVVEEEGTSKSRSSSRRSTLGSSPSQAARISAVWNHRSSEALSTALARTDNKWYQSSGRVLPIKGELKGELRQLFHEWAETLQACEGIIHFDAVLCRGPRHDPSNVKAQPGQSCAMFDHSSFLSPAIATVALGPTGCETCHSCPETPAVFGRSPASHFPLLAPVPLHSANIRVCQTPSTVDGDSPPPLFLRCEDCLKGRWCERCHKWWDECCYTASPIAQRTELQQTEFMDYIHTDGSMHTSIKRKIKVIGVRRDCFGCGHTCAECNEIFIRRCSVCRNEYCIEDNDASSDTKCDWCNYTSRRTVEMY